MLLWTGNGAVVKKVVLQMAEAGPGGADLRKWAEDHVSFPNSMVDRITPGTTQEDKDWLLREKGVEVCQLSRAGTAF